jgi:hypothetical protein
MSDFRTMVEEVKAVLDKPNDDIRVKNAIVESLRFHRSEGPFWFNEGRHSGQTTAEVYRYPLPTDFIRLIGKVYYARSNSPTSRRPLRNKTVEFVERYRFIGTDPERWGDWEAGTSAGPPGVVAIFDGELIFSPIPDVAGETFDFRYLRDLGTPTVWYNTSTSAFVVREPWSTSTLGDTFTNAWFEEGQDMIKNRAMYLLYMQTFNDAEAAQRHMMLWMEAKNKLRIESNRKRGNKSIRGHFFGRST